MFCWNSSDDERSSPSGGLDIHFRFAASQGGEPTELNLELTADSEVAALRP